MSSDKYLIGKTEIEMSSNCMFIEKANVTLIRVILPLDYSRTVPSLHEEHQSVLLKELRKIVDCFVCNQADSQAPESPPLRNSRSNPPQQPKWRVHLFRTHTNPNPAKREKATSFMLSIPQFGFANAVCSHPFDVSFVCHVCCLTLRKERCALKYL